MLFAERKPYKEITPLAVILGCAIGVIMTCSMTFVGLKLGFTIPGSGVAAIIGLIIIQVLFKGSMLANNINQTVVSAIDNAAAGIVFTVPAIMFIAGLNDFPFVSFILMTIAGSVVGVFIINPLRREILERRRIKFPSAYACKAVISAPHAGLKKGVALGISTLLGIISAILLEKGVIGHAIPVGSWMNMPEYMQLAIEVSLMSFGAGLIVGRSGIPFVFGGVLAYLILSPLLLKMGWVIIPEGADITNYMYQSVLRPSGIGMLIGAAIMGVVMSLPAMITAVRIIKSAASTGSAQDELPIRTLYLGVAAMFVVIFFTSWIGLDLHPVRAFFAGIFGVLFMGFGGVVVAECVGRTDIAPISGMSLVGVLIILAITGGDPHASVAIGAAICCAIGMASDMMTDLKTGYLIGSRPIKQQKIQLAVSWIGPIIAILVLMLLAKPPVDPMSSEGERFRELAARSLSTAEKLVTKDDVILLGIGPTSPDCLKLPGECQNDPGSAACDQRLIECEALPDEEKAKAGCLESKASCLSAPQGQALASVITGFTGGSIPLKKYITGALFGIALAFFPLGAIGILIGLAFYLPFGVTLAYGVGCFTATGIQAKLGKEKYEAFYSNYTIPIGAGLIIGESMTMVVFALMNAF